VSHLFYCVADDGELEMLAKLVEQEVSEHQSSERHVTVADMESGHAALCQPQTESAASDVSSDGTVDDGCCSLNSDPVANTETPVTETEEQCQYYCYAFSVKLCNTQS